LQDKPLEVSIQREKTVVRGGSTLKKGKRVIISGKDRGEGGLFGEGRQKEPKTECHHGVGVGLYEGKRQGVMAVLIREG